MGSNFEGLQFYRCMLCNRIVTVWDIRERQGCRHCGNRKLKPTDLTMIEKLVQILKHPAVWRWKHESL